MNRQSLTIALRFWVALLGLWIVFPTNSPAQRVMVGDIEVDPQDFAAHQDPGTRVAPCLACHGQSAGGDADFGPDTRFGTPALRGMRQAYLQRSLMDYKTGRRNHKEMRLIVAMLDRDSIDFMARAFAAYPAAPPKSADALATIAAEDHLFRKGQAIAREGIPDNGVPACMDCHGALGEGDPDLGPRLAGQNALFIGRQFAAYAENSRQSEQSDIMQSVATGLSGDEVEAVAHYYQNLIRVVTP